MPSYATGNRVLAALVVCAALGADPAWSQDAWRGARFGLGVDMTGEFAGVGQVEIVSYGDSGSAELALIGFRAGRFEEYTGARGTAPHDYSEDTQVRGLGLAASYLFGHGRGQRGPYVGLGLGLGALDVDWTKASPTDNFLPTPTPGGGGGSINEQRVILGSLVNVGLGLQLNRNADLRAQVLALLASSTEMREDLKFVPLFTLSAAFGF